MGDPDQFLHPVKIHPEHQAEAVPERRGEEAGPGGGPHVRIFNGNGVSLSPGFFPLDKTDRDGVRVMVDNIDALGNAEILINSPLF